MSALQKTDVFPRRELEYLKRNMPEKEVLVVDAPLFILFYSD